MLLACCIGIYLAVGVYGLGRRRVGFSYWRHTISELGERGASDGRLASWGLFLPIGVALAALWLLHRHSAPEAAALAAVIAVGYLGAAAFPCDPGSPSSGSISQTLHNLAGGVEYVGGVLCLLSLRRETPIFLGLAAAVAVVIPLLSLPIGIPVRGAVQRVAEVCLFGGLVLALALQRVA